MIGPNKRFLCGDRVTLADYMGAEMVALGEVIRSDFKAYPNVQRWLKNMKALKSWPKVHEVIEGFTASVKDQPFVAV